MAREFTGELDSERTVKEFTGALDPAIPTAAGAKRLGSPSFIDQIAGTVGKLFGNTSVMDGLDGITPASVSPADAIASTQASNRAIANIMAERNAPGERRREFSRSNPKLGALASGSAQVLQNTLDAVPLAADVFNNYAIDPVLNAVGLKPMDQAPRLPGAKQLQDAARDYAPTIAGRSLKGAWNNDQMVEWLGANLMQQAPQISQSVGAALIPGSRIPLLLGMGGQAGAGAYQQNKDEGFAKGAAVADALTKGNIEVLSEMLPLGVFDRVKGLVGNLPSPVRGAVMADAAKRVLAGGAALTAQGLTGAIEESVAQLGGNASENIMLGKDTPLLDKVPESAVLGAAAGKVLGLPHVFQTSTAPSAQQQIANAIEEGVAKAEYEMPAEQVARASMAPNERQMLKTLQPAVKEFTGELDQPEKVDDLSSVANSAIGQQPPVSPTIEPIAVPADESGSSVAIPNSRAQQSPALIQTEAVPILENQATHKPVAEMAAEVERPIQLPDQITDQSMQLEVAPEGLRPGDIVAASGKPFVTKAEAQKEQRLAGKGWQVRKGAGGFVVRHQPQSDKQISATRNRMRQANQVDTESDSMFAAIAKLGGIRLDDLTKQWGFDPAEFQRLRGFGIKRVGTKGGMSLDRAGEALAELGYLSYDENGKHDLSELFDLFDGELRGNKHYTPQGYAKVGQAMQEQGWLEAQLAEELDNLPEEAQTAIEDLLDEYENTTAETEAELESRLEREGIDYDSSASLDAEVSQDNTDASAEERIDRSIDQAFESPSPASTANQRTNDVGESAGRVRSESVIAAEEKARKERLAIQRRYEQDADKFARDRDLAAVRAELEAAQDNDKPFDDVPFSRKAGSPAGMSVAETRAAIATDTFHHDVDVYATLDEAPQYIQIQARREGGGDVEGYWDMAKNKVALIAANLDSPERAREVARHELIGHYGLENMLNDSADPGAMSALVKRVIRADKDGNKLIRDLGSQVDRSQPDLDEQRRAKEIIAIMAERNIQNSITRRVYDAIRAFLKKIGFIDGDITDAKIANLLRQAQDYLRAVGRPMEHGQSAAAFAREDQTPLESGTPLTREEVLAKQAENERAMKEDSKSSKLKEKDVTADQVDMFNEQGSLSARSGNTESDAFKRWFNDSKVVDSNGKPLVVYHSTNALPWGANNIGFSAFITDTSEGGAHFGTKDQANSFGAGANRRIMPVYLSLKKPLRLVDAGSFEAEYLAPQLADMGIIDSYEDIITTKDAQKAIEAAGYDGIIYLNRREGAKDYHGEDSISSEALDAMSDADVREQFPDAEDSYIAFHPQQVKSAIGNNGEYDSANPNVNFSRRAQQSSKGLKVDHSQDDLPFNPRSAFTVSEPGILDNVTRAMQNNKIDLKRIQEAIRAEGRGILENHDAYLNEELYIGRVTDQIDKFVDKRVTPLLEAIDKAGVSLEDVNSFLYARHAPERNAQLKKINPNRIDNDRLSGMSDVRAAGIMSGFRESGHLEALQAIAAMVDAITKESRRRIVTTGLETAEVIQAWEDVYKHYVPLMADMEVQIGKKKGGYTVKGEESQRSLGQLERAQNIIANVVAQAQGTIMRSEKAKVGRSLLDLARAHPNDKFWKVDEPPKKRRINKETGLVEWAEDPMFKTRDNVLVVKENGKEHYLVLEPTNERAMQLAAAMQNLDAAQLPWVIEATGKFTRHLAQWITARNPLFWITNFTRDVQGAAFNLQNTPIAGKEMQVMGNIPKAMRGYWKITRGDGSGKWADYAREFKSAGAETGYIKVFDSPDDHMADLEKQLAQMQQGDPDPRKLARSMIEAIDDYNTIIENGVRLAVYQTARENGVTIRKAASIAKNITVNFNRRGNQSTGWNALYMFMNASIQGNVRFLSAVATSRRAQVVAASLVGMGFVLDAVNRAIGGDDDETGWKKYDEIPEWDKERNWIFMAPNGKYIKVPMPYGPHIALNMGRMMSEMIFGRDKKVVDRALSMASITVDAFNPLGSNGSFAQLLSPSVLKPVVQISENKSFTGSSLYRDADERGHIAPAYTRHFRSTPAHWKEASKLLNDVTGGDAVKPGAINVPPEVLRSLFLSYVAPGLMQTADKTIDTSTRAAAGKKIEPSQIPALSRFYGEAPEERAQERAFYEEQRKVKQAIEQSKKYAKAGDREGVQRTLTELGDGDLKKGQAIRRKWESSEKALLQLNAQRRRLETDKIDDAQQKTQLDRIEKLRLDLMKSAMR